MKNIVLKISGMKCDGCVNTVKNTLINFNGVIEVDVSLEKGKAYIKSNDNVKAKNLEEEINTKTHYKAKVESEE